MFFGASLACGFSAIQSVSNSLEFQKGIVKDNVLQSSNDINVKHLKAEIDGSLKNRLKDVLVKAKLWVSKKLVGKVNSKSDLLGNLVKKFRLTGVPVAQAIRSIVIENSKSTVKDLKSIIKNEYNLNPILDIKFIANGKVLSDFTQIAELNLRSSDVITVMDEQAGAGSFTTNQIKFFAELYRIVNPKSKGTDIDIQKIGEFLQRRLKVGKDFVQDLTNYPKDLNVILELLYYSEANIKDNIKLSQIRDVITDYVFENGFITENPIRGDGEVKTKDFLRLEYDLIKNIWFCVAVYAKTAYEGEFDGKITLELAMDLIEDHLPHNFFKKYLGTKRTLKSYLTEGTSDIDSNTLDAFIIALQKFTANNRQNRHIYQKTIKQIRDYGKTRKIRVDGNVYPKAFYSDSVMAYHLVKMIVRNLGFDILHFAPLDGKIFSATKAEIKNGQPTFIRHHFRNLKAWIRKQSMRVKDMIITDDRLHHDYEAFMSEQSEAKMQDLLVKFQQLIEIEGDITSERILSVFGENHWIFNYWNVESADFRVNLNRFNERKNLLQDLNEIFSGNPSKIEEMFIEAYYSEEVGDNKNSLYSRFFTSKTSLSFKTIMNRGLERIIAHHNNHEIMRYLGSMP